MVGCSAANAPQGPSEPPKLPVTTEVHTTGEQTPQAASGAAQGPQVAANTLQAPSVGLNIPVVDSPVIGGEMQLPDSSQAGRLALSAPLNSNIGTTVIAGHVNWPDDTYAPMSAIYHLGPGDKIQAGGHEYTATRALAVDQDELSQKINLTDTKGPRKLILITCKATPAGYTENYVIEATEN